MEDTSVLVFSGYNIRAVIAFLRTLSSLPIRYGVAASSDYDPIFETVYKDHVTTIRSSERLDLSTVIGAIEDVKKRLSSKSVLIAPSTEFLNRFLLNHRAEIEQHGAIIPLVDDALYQFISNKESFSTYCSQNGVQVPRRLRSDQLAQAKLPFVAKPRVYFLKDGSTPKPQLIFTEEQKSDFFARFDPSDFFFEEYVEGVSKYLLFYKKKNGQLIKFSQSNIAQQPNGGSIIAAKPSNIHDGPISDVYESILKKLGFHGLVMIEVRFSKDGIYLIEANPRFWGPSQLFVDNGLNFFEYLLADYGLISEVPSVRRDYNGLYFWFAGFIKSWVAGKNIEWYSDKNEFLLEFDEWVSCDVFKREDTIALFQKEMIWNPLADMS